MNTEDALRKLEGMHTLETAMEALGMKRQSVLNLLCKLRKEGYVSSGRGKRKLYRITRLKQRPRSLGMFDVLNKYNPNFQLRHWFDHQVHGEYTVEDAIVDAIQTKSFRAILATLRLFSHVKDWKKLHRLAKEKGCWQQVGALYDVGRLHFRVRRMPKRYGGSTSNEWKKLTQLHDHHNFPEIQEKWHVYIPFNENDVAEVA
jgi:DNA-binding IscR family transcriptional regulator